jgi:hypothetical protein
VTENLRFSQWWLWFEVILSVVTMKLMPPIGSHSSCLWTLPSPIHSLRAPILQFPSLYQWPFFLSPGACTLKTEATGSSKTLVLIYHHFTSYKTAIFSHHFGNILNIFRLLLTLHYSSLLSFLALFQSKLGGLFHSIRHALVWLMFHFPHICFSVTCWCTIQQSYIRTVHETCQFHTIWYTVQTATCELSLCLSNVME